MFRLTAIAGWRRLRVLQANDSAAYYKLLERELAQERFLC